MYQQGNANRANLFRVTYVSKSVAKTEVPGRLTSLTAPLKHDTNWFLCKKNNNNTKLIIKMVQARLQRIKKATNGRTTQNTISWLNLANSITSSRCLYACTTHLVILLRPSASLFSLTPSFTNAFYWLTVESDSDLNWPSPWELGVYFICHCLLSRLYNYKRL